MNDLDSDLYCLAMQIEYISRLVLISGNGRELKYTQKIRDNLSSIYDDLQDIRCKLQEKGVL